MITEKVQVPLRGAQTDVRAIVAQGLALPAGQRAVLPAAAAVGAGAAQPGHARRARHRGLLLHLRLQASTCYRAASGQGLGSRS